jgi:hypothetical protein
VKRLAGYDATDDEIARRWRAALQAEGFHRCDSLARLATPEVWNQFARPASSGGSLVKMRPLGAPGVR